MIKAAITQKGWGGKPAERSMSGIEEEAGPVRVSHVVDSYNRYPGEVVTFYTRLEVRESLARPVLRFSLPEELELKDYRPPAEQSDLIPSLEVGESGRYLAWTLQKELPAGACYEFRAEATIMPLKIDVTLTSQATVTDKDGNLLAAESVSVAVRPKGKYLQSLPAIYEQDELMGRFLMLFESFWSPIETQIDSIYNYFDPRLTPVYFLPWLASWLDVELEEHWPEEGRRQLLRWAIALHRSRGTRWGLLKYLELYTGQKAEIIERRSKNFVLGTEVQLGPSIALGRGNTPHTFTVTLRLPPIKAKSKKERKRLEEVRQRTIEAIIERQKPAHTIYTLHLESLSSAEAETEAEKPEQPAERKDDEIAAQAAIWFKLDD